MTADDRPGLEDFRNLVDADVRPDRKGIVIAEGVNVVDRLLRSSYRVRAIVGVAAKLSELGVIQGQQRVHSGPAIVAPHVPVHCVDKWELSELAGFRVTRGFLASAERPPAVDPQHLINRGRRFVVLEATNDFENLGSIFRNAAAFGLDAVLLDPRCADPLYRRSVRVSMGHIFAMPFATLPGPWPQSLALIRQRGVPLLAMTPRSDAVALERVRGAEGGWAVMLGAEGPGLSEAALTAADQRVRIPMAAGVDSLNVATAGAVAFAGLPA